jgi:hypothetical protein
MTFVIAIPATGAAIAATIAAWKSPGRYGWCIQRSEARSPNFYHSPDCNFCKGPDADYRNEVQGGLWVNAIAWWYTALMTWAPMTWH